MIPLYAIHVMIFSNIHPRPAIDEREEDDHNHMQWTTTMRPMICLHYYACIVIHPRTPRNFGLQNR